MSITMTPPGAGLDRYALQRVLGEGAQAVVWLAFDRRLEREVALKLLRAPAGADPAAVGEWLREARSVSRLNHPHIVQLYDADLQEQGQGPFLVFEYVAGPTLAAHLKARGALPANEAVGLTIDVLDALHAAHAAGVVHRDLKPSNVLIGAAGRARVMDFGIAARLHDADEAPGIVGTPGYMSPEAARGAMPTAAMDLFSVGVMLAEALSGQRLVAERDAQRAMQRVIDEDLDLPDGLAAEVDDALRTLLRRALARDPAQRWASAAEFRDALQAWLSPAAGPGADVAAQPPGGALDFLLRRMRHNSDFPALSDAVGRIQRVAASEDGHLERLSDEILKDVALTSKLLRMVNTAHFHGGGTTHVGTVSRAVALVGFNGIRNLAMSLVLLEHMRDKAHAQQLQEEFLRSLLAGMLAGELGTLVHDGEQAFIGAMFQNLGRQLTEFYFPHEARQVRGIVAAGGRGGAALSSEASASGAVLGVSYEQLGLGVARVWGLPPALQRCMLKPAGEPPPRALDDAVERVRWLAHAANQVSDALLMSAPDEGPARIAALGRRYARALGIEPARFEAAAANARQRLAQMAQSMNLQVSAQSPARRLFAQAPLDADAAPDLLLTHSLQATLKLPPPEPEAAPAPDAAAVLIAGIQDVTDTLVGDFSLDQVLRMILETMYRALGLRRIVLCLRDARGHALQGRLALGDDAAAVAARFHVPLARANDLFSAVCLKNADTLIEDATQPRIAAGLPAWYREAVHAPAFVLLPLAMNAQPLALIYGDVAAPGGIALGEKELALLRTLRNQAVMAFKQSA